MAEKVISIEDRIPKLREKRKKRANRRLAFILFLFFLLMLSILYFQSPISRLDGMDVKGNRYVDRSAIVRASGLTEKTIVLNIDEEKVEKRILSLPEIKKATVKTVLPNHVEIRVVENERVGHLRKDGKTYVLLENGEFTDPSGQAPLSLGPLLDQFDDPEIIEKAARELEQMPDEIRNAISEIIYSPSKTDPYRIIAFMNDGMEIHATLKTFAEKMEYYPSLIKQLEPGQKGIIDIQVGMFFRSYESGNEEGGENDGS